MKKKKKFNHKKRTDQRKITDPKNRQGFWDITKQSFREAVIWIFSVLVITGLFAIIMGRPFLFTIHRSLYLVGLALGVYAILESIVKKERGLQGREERRAENERVRRIRNIGIYRGFIVMAAAALVEILDYVLS